MKRFSFGFIFTVLLMHTSIALAQVSFEFTPPEETSVTIEPTGFHGFYGHAVNTSSGIETFTFSLTNDNMPDDWISSICIGTVCYPPFLREVDADLTPGIDTLVLVDIGTGSGDNITGSLSLVIRSVADPEVTVSVDYYVTISTNNVGGQANLIVKEFELTNTWPNPFNNSANISFTIPKNSYITMQVIGIDGRLVQTLIESEMTVGSYSIPFTPDRGLSSGSYFIRMISENNMAVRPITYIK